MNKLTFIGGALVASITFEPIAASAYDVFSYRYDHDKQQESDSPEETQVPSSKTTFVEPNPAPLNTSQATNPEHLKPSKRTGLSSKRVPFSNPRK